MESSVVVVTVTHNSADALGRFLASVRGASESPLSVVVADNASADVDSVRRLTAAHGAVLVETGANLGYGAGVAAAIAAAGGSEFIVISNPDVEMSPGAIDLLVAAAGRHPDAGSLGPRILDAEGAVYPSARALPSLRTGIGHGLFTRVWPGNPWSRRYKAGSDLDAERAAGWLSGACLMVRRVAFDAIDGFDDSYFMYFEDVDLGHRLGRAGWANVYVPAAVVTHTGAHSTAQSARSMEKVHHQSAYLYLSRRYSAWYLAPVRWVLKAALTIRYWWVSGWAAKSPTIERRGRS